MGRGKFFDFFANILIIGACFFAVFRLFSFLSHDPLLAYANNYDMIRIQACHQIWPAQSSPAAGASSRQQPLEQYMIRPEMTLGTCYPSSELIFTSLLSLFLEESQVFSIRRLAAIKVTLSLTAIALVLFPIYRVSRGLAAGATVVTLILMSDPFNTLYLPTFYTEWSAFLGFVVSALLLLLALCRPDSVLFSVLLAAALVFLGLSRMQHIIMPFLAFACVLPGAFRVGWKVLWRPLLALSAACVLVAMVQISWMQSERNINIRAANATNTILFTVLGSSKNPEELAQFLGLPRACTAHAGTSWYSTGFDADKHPCPEVTQVKRLLLLALPFVDPAGFTAMIRASDASLRPVFPAYLGQVAGQNLGDSANHFKSFYRWLEWPSFGVLLLFALTLVTISSAYCVWKILGSARTAKTVVAACSSTLFLSSVVPSVYFVSIFGDGFIDLAKHNHLGFNALFALSAIVLWYCVGKLLSRLRK